MMAVGEMAVAVAAVIGVWAMVVVGVLVDVLGVILLVRRRE